ncbi:hypothetical protein ADK86_27475 [Streptomyces sp. NRRL F-5755]|nr:hypothetical protein ADK86_27475 [Streptomyces sp. NRRL F-5755]
MPTGVRIWSGQRRKCSTSASPIGRTSAKVSLLRGAILPMATEPWSSMASRSRTYGLAAAGPLGAT